MSAKTGVLVLAAAGFISACGGGGDSGGSTSPPPPQPVSTNASGVWEGTAVSSGMTIEFAGVVTEDGEGRLFDENGTQYVIDSLDGNDGNVSLTFTAVAQIGFVFVDGSTVSTGSMTGTVDEHATFQGDYSLATGESGTVSMTYNSVYDRDSSLEKLTGNWQEDFGVVTFDPDGDFFLQDSSGCVYEGLTSIIDPDYNAYRLSMTVSLCGSSDGQYSGLGVLTDLNATDDLFIIQMSNETFIFTTSIVRL